MMEDWGKVIPLALIAGLTLMQVYIRLSARLMRGRTLPELAGVIDATLLKKPRLAIYFSSEYCQPCKEMAPMIERLQGELGNIVKLDAIEHGELATKLHARGAPAFVFIEEGRVAEVHLGSLTEARLRKRLA